MSIIYLKIGRVIKELGCKCFNDDVHALISFTLTEKDHTHVIRPPLRDLEVEHNDSLGI